MNDNDSKKKRDKEKISIDDLPSAEELLRARGIDLEKNKKKKKSTKEDTRSSFTRTIKQFDSKWHKKDILQVITYIIITLVCTIRKGPILKAALTTLRYLLAYYVYGIVIVMLFVGLTKKPLKYNPTKKQIIKWIIFMAAFFAVSQFIHEGFLMLTGQWPPK